MDGLGNFDKVDPRLCAAMVGACVEYERTTGGKFWCRVTSGFRTPAAQKRLVAKGVSQTVNSFHCKGLAVDIALLDMETGEYLKGTKKAEVDEYKSLADLVQQWAFSLGVLIEWGGDWKTFKDLGHFQLRPPPPTYGYVVPYAVMPEQKPLAEKP